MKFAGSLKKILPGGEKIGSTLQGTIKKRKEIQYA
jgi:hypothetical protein